LISRGVIRACALGLSLFPVAVIKASVVQDITAERLSVVEDWTSRHVIYSGPQSASQAKTMAGDDRYQQQWLRRSKPAFTGQDSLQALVRGVRDEQTAAAVRDSLAPVKITKGPPRPKRGKGDFRADWAMSLGAGGTVGGATFPAKYNFDIGASPSCANDFVVYNTSLAGATSTPSIVAFNKLYSAQGSAGGYCNQDGPSTMWSYNTGLGAVVTSPILSLDGTKVIYVQTSGSGAVLHILKWKAGEGTIGTPAVPTQTVSTLASCTGSNSCDVQLAVSGAPAITNSSPFYDYSSDALYVGDDSGKLHKFAPVLNGTLTEVAGNWPITVNAGQVLSSPVIDRFGSGNVFVGDASGRLSYVRESFSTAGTCASGSVPCLGGVSANLGGAIVDSPILDGSTGKVFVFNGKDTNRGSVYQFNSTLGAQVTASVGNASITTPVNLHAGAFDQGYLTSVNGTGYLYVCGKVSTGTTDRPAIHRIAITAGAMNGASDGGLAVSTESSECSPVTSVYNAPTNSDYIFFSIGDGANQTAAGCTSGEGCLMSLNLTALNGVWNPGTTPATVTRGYRVPTLASGAGTSGIIVDNTVFPASTTLGTTASTTLVGSASTTLAAPAYVLTAEVDRLAFSSQPNANNSMTIAGVTYTFLNNGFAAPPVNTCHVRRGSGVDASVVSLYAAINNGSTGGDNSTYLCNATGGNQPSNGVTATATDSATYLDITAKIPGAAGFAASAGTAPVTVTETTIGRDNSITVTSAAGIAVNDILKIDSEQMQVTSIASAPLLVVTRGVNSTTQVFHASAAVVTDLTVSSSSSILTLGSTTGIATGDYLLIDSEKVLVGTVSSPRVTVTRGQLSTSAATHTPGATAVNITTAAVDTVVLTSNTASFAVNDYILVDSEIMQITAVTPNVSFGVTRNVLGSTPAAAHQSPSIIFNLSANTASIYFSFFGNSSTGAPCNGSNGVGCAVKLTQVGLR